jgi:glycosyltransferase involved in cell wall biosynthesis
VLDSVAGQRFSDFELIISDDTPDDRVEVLLRNYDFGGRLRYTRNPMPLGSPANWNRCIGLASSPLVKLLHHDDWFADEGSLGDFVTLMDAHPDADFGVSATRLIRPDYTLARIQKLTTAQVERLMKDPYSLFFGNYVGSPSVTIVRRSDLAYDPALKWLVDVDFYIRALERNCRVAYTDRPLICTMIESAEQVTAACEANPTVDIGEHLFVLERNFSRLSGRKELLRFLGKRLGSHGVLDTEALSQHVDVGRLRPEIVALLRLANPGAQHARDLVAGGDYRRLRKLHAAYLRLLLSESRGGWTRYWEILVATLSEHIFAAYRLSPSWVQNGWRRMKSKLHRADV